MRLYKKAAACLLTAAMAISMLTACGGGGNGGNGGGNTPSTLPNPGEIILPAPDEGGGAGGGEGTETKPTKTLIDVNSSKLAKFKEKYAGATEFYVEMQEVDYGEDGSVKQSYDGCLAAKDDNVYTKATVSRTNQKQQSVEQLMLKELNYNNSYLLLRDSKVAVRTEHYKSESDDNISLGTLIANKLPDLMWSTEVKVGPTKYYAEVYNLYSYEYTTCFTADGKPVYRFVRKLNEKQLESATLYKTIQAGSGTSKGRCEMPDGFKTYSYNFRNKTLTDVNDNVFTIETNDKGDITSVKDNTGKNVSDDFKWVYDHYMLFK